MHFLRESSKTDRVVCNCPSRVWGTGRFPPLCPNRGGTSEKYVLLFIYFNYGECSDKQGGRLAPVYIATVKEEQTRVLIVSIFNKPVRGDNLVVPKKKERKKKKKKKKSRGRAL